jgi:hypothetical protein
MISNFAHWQLRPEYQMAFHKENDTAAHLRPVGRGYMIGGLPHVFGGEDWFTYTYMTPDDTGLMEVQGARGEGIQLNIRPAVRIEPNGTVLASNSSFGHTRQVLIGKLLENS